MPSHKNPRHLSRLGGDRRRSRKHCARYMRWKISSINLASPSPRPLVRRHMGLAKKDHIRKLLEEPEVKEQWQALRNAAPQERDVDAIYAKFEPQMMEVLAGYATVISGVVDAVEAMRARGMKIAGTTGYTRPMLDRLEALAAQQGYRTDRSLAPEDAGGGRPFPWMCYRLAMDLRIYPLSACVKIGDTESDIEEGLNAGMWTIGVTRSGNTVGLSEADWLQARSTANRKSFSLAPSRSCVRREHTTPRKPLPTRCRSWTRSSAESPTESARNEAGARSLPRRRALPAGMCLPSLCSSSAMAVITSAVPIIPSPCP